MEIIRQAFLALDRASKPLEPSKVFQAVNVEVAEFNMSRIEAHARNRFDRLGS
jgi:hypothetical protein